MFWGETWNGPDPRTKSKRIERLQASKKSCARPDGFGLLPRKKPSARTATPSKFPTRPQLPLRTGRPHATRTRAEGRQAGATAGRGRHQAASMLELLLVGCSSVVVLLHGASLFLRALFAPRHAVARPISFLGFVA
ncbi:uncharacterized protein LOC120710135 [Panicum virgatum]|nr:uncharacterized protein LOC120710135 [Panicum virgatum]